ncbi:MAG: hypothetical protein AAB734_04770 [Patescibacteria group bacterium]
MGYWSFAIINGKLAEISYDEMKDGTRKLFGHCYVKASEYTTRQEKKYIKEDTKKMRFSWRKKKYQYLGKEPIRYITGSIKEWLF